MTTKTHCITIGGLAIEVVRKNIKNLHLGVYPPNGRVRVAAPLVVSDEAVRRAIMGKLAWIKRHQARFAQQIRQEPREIVSGEGHYFMGQRYQLRVMTHAGPPCVRHNGTDFLDLYVHPDADAEQRLQILQRWYRERLRALIPPMLEQWQKVLAVQVAEWGIKRMKTRWGTCNIAARRIWLNLELIKKPTHCLEYIIVHELTHLIERNHTARFKALMDGYLPHWRLIREELNRTPLGYEEWRE